MLHKVLQETKESWNQERRCFSVSQGRVCQLVVEYQTLSPVNIHNSNCIKTI